MKTKNQTNKIVTDLQSGDLIDPPAGEKVWLWRDGTKRRYTVNSVKPGKVTKRGQFVKISATCPSPYGDELMSINCEMIETKRVTVHSN